MSLNLRSGIWEPIGGATDSVANAVAMPAMRRIRAIISRTMGVLQKRVDSKRLSDYLLAARRGQQNPLRGSGTSCPRCLRIRRACGFCPVTMAGLFRAQLEWVGMMILCPKHGCQPAM